MNGRKFCSVAFWNRETSNQFQMQQNADLLPGCGVTGCRSGSRFASLWFKLEIFQTPLFNFGPVLNGKFPSLLLEQLVSRIWATVIHEWKWILSLCQFDLLQEMLVSALGGECNAAPQSVHFKIKLCQCFFFCSPALLFMCICSNFATSYSLFLRTQCDISLTLWSCLYLCLRASTLLKGCPKRPCLVECAFRSCHIFSQLRDTTDKPLPVMSLSPASHLVPSWVPPVLSSSSLVPLRVVCPFPLNYTLLCSCIKGTSPEDFMQVTFLLLPFTFAVLLYLVHWEWQACYTELGEIQI